MSEEKRCVGRPRVGTAVRVILPPELKSYIQTLADTRGVQRGTLLRQFIVEAIRLFREGHFTLPPVRSVGAVSVEEKIRRFGNMWITCGVCGEDYGKDEEHVCKPKRKAKK